MLMETEQRHAHHVVRPRWESTYAASILVLDAVAITVAAIIAHVVRFGMPREHRPLCVSCGVLSPAFPPVWIAIMAASRAYESRFLGVGSEEFRRVGNAAI